MERKKAQEAIKLSDDENILEQRDPSPDIFDGLIIDLTYDEEREILEEIVVNHTTRSAIPSQRRAATIPKRNANSIAKPIVRQRNRRIEPPYLDFGETDTDQGFKLEEGDTVELNENYVKKFGQFLFIRNVIFHETTLDIELRGLVLNRNSKAGGMLERQLNEVHISAEIDEDDPRSIFHQAMVDVPIQAVLCKRKLVFSDQLHPLENYQFNPEYDATMPKDIRIRHIVDHEHLTCRNVLLTSFPNAHGREHGCRRSQIRESNLWLVDIMIKELRSKVKYDSQTPPPTSPRKRPERSVSLEMRDSPPSKRTRLESSNISADQPITYASAFSGCGGDACGARMAGADVKGAFDENAECCKTFIMNFIRAQVLNKSAFYAQELVYAMLLHLSPPCQPWSPAHTIAGRNDAKNIDALFAVGEVISRQEPEFVTLEQTVGLLNKKNNRRYFNALVNQIIYAGQGYNIRWGVMDFRQYGVMSNRCRLVFIASRRGLPLPPFPRPTHGPPGSGLKPFETVWSALAPLRRTYGSPNAPSHNDPKNPKHCYVFPSPRESYDPTTARTIPCITTNGGKGDVAPDGQRTFTIREKACLMTVPPDYKFPDLPRSVLLRQIGNMVPPLGWKPFVNSVAEFRRAFYAGKIDVTGRTINDAALTIVPTTTNATALNMRAQLGMPDRPQEAGLTRRMRQLSVSDDSSHTMSPDPLSDDEVQRSQFRQHSTQTEKSQSDKTQYWDLTLMEDD